MNNFFCLVAMDERKDGKIKSYVIHSHYVLLFFFKSICFSKIFIISNKNNKIFSKIMKKVVRIH